MNFIDLTPFRCPLPLVKVKLALKTLSAGQQLHILLSDQGSRRDVPLFLKKQGYIVEDLCNDAAHLSLKVTKVAPLAVNRMPEDNMLNVEQTALAKSDKL